MDKPEIIKFPAWLRKTIPVGGGQAVEDCLVDLRLDTVCRGARCPNRLDCLSRGRAAFMVMGPRCTRSCRFCAIANGEPPPLDPEEPVRLAEAVKRLGLRHAVVTSVTRDDLPDGGAGHFAEVVRRIRGRAPETTVEILAPDFRGDEAAWEVAVDAAPDVFNHNLETVKRLYEKVRPQADYDLSLALLDFARERRPEMTTKSGLMLGLGEELDEIVDAARDLRGVGVDAIVVGQYLQPKSDRALPVERFVKPGEFADLERELLGLGFRSVACSPFVRSSYNAEEAFLRMGEAP
ncbi:MAG: lipoyl synthase [Planctomycetota bacterium]|jgi:lipoic acid synthetase|nr:lipoyl synthase [Planctomycetota bacterium]